MKYGWSFLSVAGLFVYVYEYFSICLSVSFCINCAKTIQLRYIMYGPTEIVRAMRIESGSGYAIALQTTVHYIRGVCYSCSSYKQYSLRTFLCIWRRTNSSASFWTFKQSHWARIKTYLVSDRLMFKVTCLATVLQKFAILSRSCFYYPMHGAALPMPEQCLSVRLSGVTLVNFEYVELFEFL